MKTYNTENPIWYAVMADHEDTDWGYGSSNYAEAVTMCKDMREDGHPDAFIAVIDDGNDPTCIDEITDLDNEKGAETMKTIYIAREANDNTDTTAAFFDKEQATLKAIYWYKSLTAKERETNTVSLETWSLPADDGMTADEIWQSADADDLTSRDPDDYETVDNVFVAIHNNNETPFTPKSKVFDLNGHTVEVFSCLYLYEDEPEQEGILVHDMTDKYHNGDAIYGNGNIIDNIDDADDLKDIIEYEAAETSFGKLADGLYKIL